MNSATLWLPTTWISAPRSSGSGLPQPGPGVKAGVAWRVGEAEGGHVGNGVTVSFSGAAALSGGTWNALGNWALAGWVAIAMAPISRASTPHRILILNDVRHIASSFLGGDRRIKGKFYALNKPRGIWRFMRRS